jgi:hypothetical protein
MFIFISDDTETGKILHKQFGCGAKTMKKTDEPNEKQHVGSVNAITMSHDDDSTIFVRLLFILHILYLF